MACFHPDLERETVEVPRDIFAELSSAIPGDPRRLMVSDNPETLDADIFIETNITLWHDVVKTSDTCVKHRIFGWHLNRMNAPIQVGITVENFAQDNALQIQDVVRQQHFNPRGWLMEVGQCLAKSCISGTLEQIEAVDNVVEGGEVGLLEVASVPDEALYGFIYEFSIVRSKGSADLDYVIRTVASQDLCANVRHITEEPIPNDLPHPRGSWPFSETVGTTGMYEVGTAKLYRTCAPEALDKGEPVDAIFVPETSDVPGSRENIGQYGAVYTVQVPILNNTEEEKTVHIRVNPRGGAFAGAAEINGEVYGIPLLRPYNDTALIDAYSAPPGVSLYTFRYMTAGASSLPLAIYLTTV
ncbi:hypothetical protein [Aureibacillus halotolerans]|uniref:Uncharacterized protein n=1 Tax=Aureibacillus halotolerans TaxID=1508390 RepID=A0A4R6U8J5_9BACI|nr:hypothetical protein [Aureibacillus halotolerans]TDQ41109.1 hypothetical protein EV213_104107 [Aureibacillus halotolerans]